MARTVVALYDTFDDANAAVRELVDNNFSREDISLMANDQSGDYGRYVTGTHADETTETTQAAEGAGLGASVGATLGGIGGLLIGLGALTIPGIGPVIAAGPLAAALAGLAGAGAGALVGGVTGGLIGALVNSGVPEETAQYYSEGIRRGGTLVTVNTDETMSGRAVNIMNRHNPVDINSRVSAWRQEGWTGFHSEEDAADVGHDYDSTKTGTVRGVVDTGIETTEERYGAEQNIPATGDHDRTYGSAGVAGQPPSSTMTDPERNYSEGGSRGMDLGNTGGREGMMSHDRSSSYNRDVTDMRGQDFTTTGREGTLGSTGQEHHQDMPHHDSDTGITHEPGFGEMEKNPGYSTGVYRDFSYYDSDFRNHFSAGTYGTTYDYDQFRPAYRYGYDLATDPRYTNREWNDIEVEARRYWDEREPGAWERFKDSVHEAWQRVKDSVS